MKLENLKKYFAGFGNALPTAGRVWDFHPFVLPMPGAQKKSAAIFPFCSESFVVIGS